ncbi:hypothetical protein B9G69_002305 [Bdellovibrio sp. SKB1291214]|uniref:hypothetical protein n=1 Tax=Bdellovibrio sp. SKB1291214 TaxID=1732569 RepID=UPI000B51C87E|nr:hypothetical protein [Bdellovibrio sp. SKB1291214]UYL09404.1 hypothetical protein B9G69_002305 [Bdellovibrio sp. SKB1291214]
MEQNKPIGVTGIPGIDQGDNGISKSNPLEERNPGKGQYSGTADTTGKQVDERSRKDLSK